MGKGEIARNEQFLLFPQCFLHNQIIVSPFVHIFDIIFLFAAELEKPKIGLSGKEFTNWNQCYSAGWLRCRVIMRLLSSNSYFDEKFHKIAHDMQHFLLFPQCFLSFQSHRRCGVVVRASALWAGGGGFDGRPRQTKVCKTGSGGFPPLALRNMGIALRLARQCQDNRLVKYWLKSQGLVFEWPFRRSL